jgi:hypothetical protein
MDTSRDRITLTSQERSVSADLEVRAGRSDPKLARSLTVGSHRGWARLRVRRDGDVAVLLLFAFGMVVMLATFARWPIVGAVGLVVQAIALNLVLARWASRIGGATRR